MAKKREIRNSTAEFLTFVAEGKENGIQVLYKDETIWATQKAMATLFDVGVPAINKHLKNILDSGELMADSVISKMETTASDGKIYQTSFYNLDAIISVGLSCQLHPCHPIQTMVHIRHPAILTQRLYHRQEAHGERCVHR